MNPRSIGRYEIRRELGRGMMGVVYEAEDPVLGRTVALKTISLNFTVSESDRKAFEQRFLSEARAAARLSHPGIVIVYDIGRDPQSGLLFMALEYLRGETLEQSVVRGPMAWNEAVRIAARVAEALHHAHGQGIVHRDVKPANIMVLESGEPKIMDFGIAKVPTAQLTSAGQFFGSPAYMSPEQATGEPLDARSDLFSLGSVLYELLVGRKAFPGSSVPEIVAKLAYEDPEPPGRLVPGIPPALDSLMARTLAKKPEERFPDGRSLAQALDALLVSGTQPPGRAPRETFASPRAAEPAESADPGITGVAARPVQGLPEGLRVSLAVLEGARPGEIFQVDKPRMVLGRLGGGAADIELDDPEISRVHAAVECYGQRILLEDLGSTNGTYVGDERIEAREIEDRGEFRLGRTRLMLILAEEA